MLDVTPGRYRLSFTHPRFDTLGVVGPVVEVHVTSATEHQLTMPTDDEIARSVCEGQEGGAAGQPPTLLYGYVREGSSPAVVPNATVTVAWRALSARGPTVGVRNETLEVESDASGYYHVCGVPWDTQLTIRATRDTRRGVEQRIDPIGSPLTRHDVPVRRGGP
jgi:hypothetical protein